ncbi:aspartyl-tRNA synthetase, putative [Schistosoma mansoni]|uniref:aspartyl-tRNA synthetase, putative n=1 Tax=Schistosoma mansoni TaxID=6183 RepID=UPI00019B352C|nr:aspartyl-tRNA synthetase, putative [Schistosoma mansoni]|eukprot:XP_018644109.1 aspartyl-tRNA synthetase, putative [Schistosoma mansoni]
MIYSSVSRLPAFVYKSHACGELSTQHINSTVTVCGWPGHCRLSSRFLVLRDDRGSIQIYCDKNSLQIPQFNSESVLIVTGKVQARPEKDVNKRMPTGEIEIVAESIEIPSHSSPLSFLPKDAANVNEMERLKYRYIDLRSSSMQRNIRFRSSIILQMRNFLCQNNGILDIEMAFITPDDIYEIIEKMLLYIWPTVQSTSGYQTISIAFLRMEYCDAMS